MAHSVWGIFGAKRIGKRFHDGRPQCSADILVCPVRRALKRGGDTSSSPPQLFISRVLFPTRSPGDDHFSGPPVAEAALATVPGSAGRAILRRGVAAPCFPIWSCSRWGLPCLRCHHRSGELLPRHFTLTRRLAPAGGFFSVALSLGSPPVAVSDHPAHGARTFLTSANGAKARSSVQLSGAHYSPQSSYLSRRHGSD